MRYHKPENKDFFFYTSEAKHKAHPYRRAIGHEVPRLDELPRRVVHVVREVDLGHGVRRVKVRLQDVFDFGQIQLRIILFEVLK